MSEFSSGLVTKVHDWLKNNDHSQGWSLTLAGTYGNGKSSFAGALLQAWRDHMTPEVDSLDLDPGISDGIVDAKSLFVTFESFKTDSYVTDSNANTGWVGQSRIDNDYIDSLVQIQFLVLDDLCSHEMEKVQYDALHNLLRLREQYGRMTVITTNKTITEIKDLLGESVADRLRAGVVLKFVDGSQRGHQVIQPEGLMLAAARGRTMPNPDMDPDKINIPYVEPEGETCSDTPIVDQDGLNAAIANTEPATALAEPKIADSGALTPPLPPFGSCEE
ncbi:MAG: hypothetical protein GY809_16525 [Planctomycetes bacterium]|nr:hypothetical protein [Planctomycetota bacterium]